MKTITKNKIFAIGLAILLLCTGSANAGIKHLALYGKAKYADDFQHFEYVNPDAPQGGRIVMPEYGGFDNFNPFIFKGAASGTVADLIWDSLGYTPVDDISVAYPLLAKEFELPEDSSYIGFILDEKARFADGSPVTADDVIFSFKALTEQGAPIYKVYYGDVEKVEKVNNRHVRFWFKQGSQNRELPLILTQLKVFSAKDWESRDFAKPSLKIPLGNGPYKIKAFEVGKYIVLERNREYWGNNLPVRRGFYNFDEIRIDYYQDTTVTLQALFSGNIDVREEYIAKIWATGYNNEQVKSGAVVKHRFEHNNPAILQHFAFNIRRPQFKDKRVREAIDLAFNFEWANDKLFYNQYQRLYSYFTNTGLEATGLPVGKEKAILEYYRGRIDDKVFTEPFTLPDNSTPQKLRENLRKAVKLLKDAGYDFKDGKMANLKTGEPLRFTVLSNSANGSSFTRVMLPFLANLRKIGIDATFRNLEVNVFKNRMDNFDYDMAIMSYRVGTMPGTELREMFGSNAAENKGSYNIIGIQNQVVDELIDKLVKTHDKDDYEAYVKALDRVLLSEHYLSFQWYSRYNRVGYRNKFGIPDTKVKTGYLPFTWWIKRAEEK